MRTVQVTVPASSANLGPGFDSLGLALGLHNVVEITEMEEGLAVYVRGEGADSLPRDATNVVVRAARALFQAVGRAPSGLRVTLTNGIPPASGLGSSAAAWLGGVVAANALIDRPLNRKDLLKLAVKLEGHPDNVTAAFLGGLVISSYDGENLVYRAVTIEPLPVVVVLPDAKLSTGAAREALPNEVTLKDAAQNVGRTALVVQALVEGDYQLLGEAMHDRLHEPYRRKLIPGFEQADKAARDVGASAVAISGAGPALVAFAQAEPGRVAEAMAAAFQKATGKPARSWILSLDTQGIAIAEMVTDTPLTMRKRRPVQRPQPDEAREETPAKPAQLGLGEAADLLRPPEKTQETPDPEAEASQADEAGDALRT